MAASLGRSIAAGLLLLSLGGVPVSAQIPAPADSDKRVRAVRIPNQQITVDGRLTEDAWTRADPATDFLQQQPNEGQLSTERTEFRFLYDDDNLYIGGWLYDSEPDGIIINELKRDFGAATDGDLVAVVMDTFLDRRTGYAFTTNPGGALRELQTADDGRVVNISWDTVWDVRTDISEQGWTLEMVIPFKSLRFPESTDQRWGLTIQRVIRRKNERTMWTATPRQYSPFKVSYGGLLEGISGVSPGRNIRVKPFLTGGAADRGGQWTTDRDGGLDMKMGIGSSLVFDATYRTDFSQVEADEQQVNLTRFNLFFPEKREFFLENQDAFNIGPAAGAGNRNDLIPFFSRSIGLNESGEPIPMLGGLRLSGKLGRNTVGLLGTRTEKERPTGRPERPASGFTVLRYGRDFLAGSKASAFYMDKYRGGQTNRLVGADLRLITRQLDVDALVMRSTKTGEGTGVAWRGGAVYDTNITRYAASYTSLGTGFLNDLGFIPRRDVGILTADLQRRIRPRSTYRVVREYRPQIRYDRFTKNGVGLETAIITPTLNLDFADGSNFTINARLTDEVLAAPFRIRPTIIIPVGEYTYTDANVDYSSSRARPLSLNGGYRFGEFWNGTRQGVTAGGRYRFGARLATTLHYSHDRVTVPGGEFTTNLVTLRVDGSFSPRMFLNAFIQYNSVTGQIASNVRYNFMHHPLSDLFVVYNDTQPTERGLPASRAIILKLTHSLNF